MSLLSQNLEFVVVKPGEKIFQGGHMVWLGLLVSRYLLYCFLILDLFVPISLSFFFLSQEQGIMPECEICGDQGY